MVVTSAFKVIVIVRHGAIISWVVTIGDSEAEKHGDSKHNRAGETHVDLIVMTLNVR